MIFFRTICALVALSVCTSGVHGMSPLQIAKEKQNAELKQKEECIQEMKDWVDANKDRLRNTMPEEYKHVEWSDVMFYGAYIVELNNQIDIIETYFETHVLSLVNAYSSCLRNSVYVRMLYGVWPYRYEEGKDNLNYLNILQLQKDGYCFLVGGSPAEYYRNLLRSKKEGVVKLLAEFEQDYFERFNNALNEMKKMKRKAEICKEYIEGCFDYNMTSQQLAQCKKVMQILGEWFNIIYKNINTFSINARVEKFSECKRQLERDLSYNVATRRSEKIRTICALEESSVRTGSVHGMKSMPTAEEKLNVEQVQKEECIQEMKGWAKNNKNRFLSNLPKKTNPEKLTDVIFHGAYIVELSDQIDKKMTLFKMFALKLVNDYSSRLRNSVYLEEIIGRSSVFENKMSPYEEELLIEFKQEYLEVLKNTLREIEPLKRKAEICREFIKECSASLEDNPPSEESPYWTSYCVQSCDYEDVIKASEGWLWTMKDNIETFKENMEESIHSKTINWETIF